MDPDSVRACPERVELAARLLLTGAHSLPRRLQDPAETIGLLDLDDFPADLRVKFAQIHEAITAEGSFRESVQSMTPERAAQVAENIWDLAVEVMRRG